MSKITVGRTIACLLSFSVHSSAASTLIFGGDPVTAQDPIAQYTVALELIDSTSMQNTCTGAIIDSSHILTAAHCITDFQSGRVVFQLTNTTNTWFGDSVRAVTDVKANSGYLGDQAPIGQSPDLATVTFAGGLPAGFQVANFFTTQGQWKQAVVMGAPVELAGYGETEDNMADSDEGTLRTASSVVSDFFANGVSFETFQAGHGTCSGDSGGPVFLQYQNNSYVIGILSGGYCPGSSIYTSVYNSSTF